MPPKKNGNKNSNKKDDPPKKDESNKEDPPKENPSKEDPTKEDPPKEDPQKDKSTKDNENKNDKPKKPLVIRRTTKKKLTKEEQEKQDLEKKKKILKEELKKANEKVDKEKNRDGFNFPPPPGFFVMLGGPPPRSHDDDDDDDVFFETPKQSKKNKKRRRETFENEADYTPLEPKKKKEKLESLKECFDFEKYKFKDFSSFVKFMETVVYIWDKKCHIKAELCRIRRLIPTLKNMDTFVGNEEAKSNIIKLIINHLLKINYLEKESDYENVGSENTLAGMMHSVFSGPPGTGKTEFAKLVGKIFVNIGLLAEDSKFLIKRRDDFIAGYLGQTALKTRKVLNEAVGNVLFIDEAYSLGCGDRSNKDSFSKEAIDLLVEFMSNHKNDTAIFFAGYKKNLEKDLFGMNPGLERRVAWRFNFEDYKAKDLCQILKSQIHKEDWNFEKDSFDDKFFEENVDYFKNNGGDTENLFAKCKMVNSLRKFVNRYFDPGFDIIDLKKCILNKEDIENGMKCHIDNYSSDKMEERRIRKEVLQNMFL